MKKFDLMLKNQPSNTVKPPPPTPPKTLARRDSMNTPKPLKNTSLKRLKPASSQKKNKEEEKEKKMMGEKKMGTALKMWLKKEKEAEEEKLQEETILKRRKLIVKDSGHDNPTRLSAQHKPTDPQCNTKH